MDGRRQWSCKGLEGGGAQGSAGTRVLEWARGAQGNERNGENRRRFTGARNTEPVIETLNTHDCSACVGLPTVLAPRIVLAPLRPTRVRGYRARTSRIESMRAGGTRALFVRWTCCAAISGYATRVHKKRIGLCMK